MTILQRRSVSALMLALYIGQLLLPTTAYALTSGPTQPEYTSFEPVATTNMVNPMTGDFNYNLPLINVPGPNGGGYAMSLSYHAGVGMDEDASWVGCGWTLNPGAINRSKKGVPDDYKDQPVTNDNFSRDNVSITAGSTAGIDLLTFFSLDGSRSIRYNNYKGYAAMNSISLGAMDGLMSIGYNNASDVGSSYSANVNPAALLSYIGKKSRGKERKKVKDEMKSIDKSVDKDKYKAKKDELNKLDKKESARSKTVSALNSLGSSFVGYITDDSQTPVSAATFGGLSVSTSFNLGVTPTILDIPFRLGQSGNVTIQNPNNNFSSKAYGMLYYNSLLPNNNKDNAILHDYSVEKEAAYNKRDIFMPIPFSAEDDFGVTGEGLSGSFKLKRKTAPEFAPPFQHSTTYMANLNAEVQLGLDIGGGATLGGGFQNLKIEKEMIDFEYGSNALQNENPYFVFSGDKAGRQRHTTSDGVENLYLSGSDFNATPRYRNKIPTTAARDERSSFIGHHTNQDFLDDPRKVYQRRSDIESLVTRDGDLFKSLIGEIATTNEDGNRYVYGLPVYTMGERSEAFYRPEGGGGSCVPINKVVHYPATRAASAQNSPAPYANTYLITEITSSDYIDRTFNGPSTDDFGGWTKFSYHKEHGNNSASGNWYGWRVPYNGLGYEKNTLSDVRDDMASYTCGQKEIYYVKEVETKTHKAIFILNDPATEPRYDGIDAITDPFNVDVRSNPAAKGNKALRYLKRIELYAKDPNDPAQIIGKPIKTVHFEYYSPETSLCKNLPNGISIAGGTAGKLTLKKVWFEYDGVVKSTISPYEFGYEYKKLAPNTSAAGNYFRADGAVKDNYLGIVNELNQNYDENPNYNTNAADAWNNIGYKSSERNEVLRPWVSQENKELVNGKLFDPGAWNLKTIKLPSGGEILVQYEEKDYKFVQNLPVTTMVSLHGGVAANENGSNQTFVINLKDVGIDVDDPVPAKAQAAIQEAKDYRTLLINYFNSAQYNYLPSRKIYFKYLFNLKRKSTDVPQVSSCGSEYITGYCGLNAGHGQGGILYDETTNQLSISLALANGSASPKYACEDFYLNNRAMLDINDDCNNPDNIDADASPLDLVVSMAGKMFMDIKGSAKEVGLKINPVYSYLKLPMPEKRAKVGGGLRVKRIMMYDAGLTPLQETLYGTEYLYKLEDGTSSGVTTNEPVREENALVYSLDKRLPQKLAQKMLSGDDKDQFEGPIGESLLPGPSVIHSRVVTKSIYRGATAPGFTVNEYYTVKDYPSYTYDYSGVDQKNPYFPDISAILVNFSFKVNAASQNYTFITNDMHGKPRRTVRYGGNYPQNSADFRESAYAMAYQEAFDYYEPGKNIPVLKSDGGIEHIPLGVEEEVAVEGKRVQDVTNNLAVNVNVSVGYLAIVVLPQLWLSGHYTHAQRKLKTAVSSKIVHYQSYLKGTTILKDGITFRKENRLFDRYTGDPIATVTTDEYNDLTINGVKQKGVYTNYTIPAHYIYPSLGLKSDNEGFSRNENISGNTFTTESVGGYRVGDLLSIGGALCYITSIGGTTVNFVPTGTGTVSNGSKTVTVVNSGNQNKLRLDAGTITAYGNDELGGAGVAFGPFANIPNVINASATTYSDNWALATYDKALYGTTTDPAYLSGEKGKWRASSTYNFKASPLLASAKTYNTGYFGFQKFDYTNLANNNVATWLKTSQVLKYSPNGEILEEENEIGMPSAAKFAHKENVPSIIAQNARFASILFESFEDKTAANIVRDKLFAHTGNNCVSLAPSEVLAPTLTGGLATNAQIVNEGLLLRYWTRSVSGGNQALTATVKYNDPSSLLIMAKVNTKNIARVGEWSLYETAITFPQGSVSAVNTPIKVELTNSGTEQVFVDDYKIQPTESQTTSYVYDNASLRLLASFDDRHFALIYQYDAEGKLVRKLIETERGVKTISETQYNTPQKER